MQKNDSAQANSARITISDAIANYLRDAAVELSPRSIETYGQAIKRFKEYLESVNIALTSNAAALSVDHALECARVLSERGIAKKTLQTYVSAIASFYSWLLINHIIDLSAQDAELMRVMFRKYRKNGGKHLPKLPPDEVVTTLLKQAHELEIAPSKSKSMEQRRKLAHLRNIAMLEALRASGMRIGELVALRRGNLNHQNKTALVTGKGKKQRIVHFDDNAWIAIEAYLHERQDGSNGRALEDIPLFVHHDKRGSKRALPLTTHHVRAIFHHVADSAGIAIPITPHWLRHRFATKMLDSTKDLAVVQDMLGHASPETTRIYAKVSNQRIQDAYQSTQL